LPSSLQIAAPEESGTFSRDTRLLRSVSDESSPRTIRQKEIKMAPKSFLTGSAAILTFAGYMLSTPALATSHPSTPEEQAQTDALNAQQLDRARSAATVPASSQTATAPSAIGGADTTAAPSPSVTPLSSITSVPPTLANASVVARDGSAVGIVKKVMLASDGKPQSVAVALTGSSNKVIELAADELNYDQSRNVLIAELNTDQINAMPPTSNG
jgi:hypothetical protein